MEDTINKLDDTTREELADLVSTVAMLRGYLNDHIVKDLAETVGTLSKLVSAIAGTDLVDVLERSLQDPELDRVLLSPPKIGLLGLARALQDENTQRGMAIMIELLKSMGRATAPNT